jgi:hypothetical protein
MLVWNWGRTVEGRGIPPFHPLRRTAATRERMGAPSLVRHQGCGGWPRSHEAFFKLRVPPVPRTRGPGKGELNCRWPGTRGPAFGTRDFDDPDCAALPNGWRRVAPVSCGTFSSRGCPRSLAPGDRGRGSRTAGGRVPRVPLLGPGISIIPIAPRALKVG